MVKYYAALAFLVILSCLQAPFILLLFLILKAFYARAREVIKQTFIDR